MCALIAAPPQHARAHADIATATWTSSCLKQPMAFSRRSKSTTRAITAAVSGKKLSAVHDHAEAMTTLARALPGESRGREEGSVATDDGKYGDAARHAASRGGRRHQPRSGIELKKLDGAVSTLRSR
jgi:hypothetical protein